MSDESPLELCIGFYRDDPRGLATEIAKGLQRGDFISFQERCRARVVLWRARRAAAAKYPPTPEERQASASERSVMVARLALVVSVLSLLLSYLAYLKSP